MGRREVAVRRALIPLAITLILASVTCSGDESEATDPEPAAAEEQQIASTEVTVAEETEPPDTETTVADESDAPDVDVIVAVEFDGVACMITESDPSYVAADDEGLDLLTASPGATFTFLVTNTSGVDLTGLANRFDPSLSPSEAMALIDDLAVDDGAMYDEPDFIAGPAAKNLNVAALTINENQLLYHYTLQPGLNTTIVHTQDGIWPCRTGEAEISLVNVAS